jgi:hypothetical protein
VVRVIINTNLARKLHLSPFFLSLTNIIVQFLIVNVVLGFIIIIIIITPTLTIFTMSFPFIPFWLLVTIWVHRRLHIMYICQLSESGGHKRSFPSYRLVWRQLFQLVFHQFCRFNIYGGYNCIGMRTKILSRVVG